jgi:hypothetical protein
LKPRNPLFEIFALSLGVILLEVAYTRILSFKVFYYFSYLVIGIGLLGFATGGVVVALSRRLRAADLARLLPATALAGAALVGAGYPALARLPLEVTQLALAPLEVLKLAAACLALAAPFLAAGLAVAAILAAQPQRAARLYGADLLGAALGCALCVPLLAALGAPACVMLAGLAWVGAALPLSRGRPLSLGAAAALGCALAAGLAFPQLLPDPVTDAGKGLEALRARELVRFSAWHPVFRIDVADHPKEPGSLMLLLHDGSFGSAIHRFDGDFAQRERFVRSSRALPFSVLPAAPRVLVIGAAGGHEVLMSLFAGASRVVGVELNPLTLDLLRGRFAEFAGGIHRDPRVELVNAEGRSYLARTRERFDLIWFVAPDSYAALHAASAAAFVLSESYLYTVEALRASLARLAPGGVVCAQFGEFDYEAKPNRTGRWLSTARAALAGAGIGDFARHVIVASAPAVPPQSESTLLLSASPFRAQQLEAFRAALVGVEGAVLRHPAQAGAGADPIAGIVTLPAPELAAWYAAQPYQLDPVRDDSPFFWHFARFRDALGLPSGLRGYLDLEDRIGEQIMLILLGIGSALAGLLLLLPLVALGPAWRRLPGKAATALYFAGLGLGFMLIEVSMIQRLTLLLGYPTHSLTVTLCGLLVFSGLGSLASGRFAASPLRAARGLWACLALVVGALALGIGPAVEAAVGWPGAARAALALALLAPLGLCLGGFLPLGIAAVAAQAARPQALVAWAFAVNGAFSVLGSVLSTLLAMQFGFQAVLLGALALYALAVAALPQAPAGPRSELPQATEAH